MGLLKGSAVTAMLGLCYDLGGLSPCQEEPSIHPHGTVRLMLLICLEPVAHPAEPYPAVESCDY